MADLPVGKRPDAECTGGSVVLGIDLEDWMGLGARLTCMYVCIIVRLYLLHTYFLSFCTDNGYTSI
jgi:hypothetical protein